MHNPGASRRGIAKVYVNSSDVIARSQRVRPFGRPDDRLRDEAIHEATRKKEWIALCFCRPCVDETTLKILSGSATPNRPQAIRPSGTKE
jgi:hypothetical protein